MHGLAAVTVFQSIPLVRRLFGRRCFLLDPLTKLQGEVCLAGIDLTCRQAISSLLAHDTG